MKSMKSVEIEPQKNYEEIKFEPKRNPFRHVERKQQNNYKTRFGIRIFAMLAGLVPKIFLDIFNPGILYTGYLYLR